MGPLTVLSLVAAAALPQDLADLERELRSSNDKERQRAVHGLSALDSEEAWELVLRALADPAPMVADEAQLQLAQIPSGEVLELALGKRGLRSRDDLVRLRVAEALGRVALDIPAEVFVPPLGDRSPEVRRALAWSVERRGLRGDEQLDEALTAAYRDDRDPGVRAACLLAGNAGAPPGIALLATFAFCDDEAPEVRAASVLLTRVAETEKVIDILRLGAEDPSPSVRTVVAEELAARGDAPSARALVDVLERETTLRLRWRVVELLQGVSGRKHRLDVRPWRDWADELPRDWSGAERAVEVDHGPVTAALAGLPILSERIVFLIDLSGSIWMKGDDGRTRKELVDEELRIALEALGPEQHFNLIPYTGAPIPWKKGLTAATRADVKKALKWFRGRKDQGVGDLWGALTLAMADPEVDTIVALGDGAPSGGERWNLRLMKDLFLERNRFRRIALDAVLTDPPPSIVRYWREMTAESGGRLLEISFDDR